MARIRVDLATPHWAASMAGWLWRGREGPRGAGRGRAGPTGSGCALLSRARRRARRGRTGPPVLCCAEPSRARPSLGLRAARRARPRRARPSRARPEPSRVRRVGFPPASRMRRRQGEEGEEAIPRGYRPSDPARVTLGYTCKSGSRCRQGLLRDIRTTTFSSKF